MFTLLRFSIFILIPHLAFPAGAQEIVVSDFTETGVDGLPLVMPGDNALPLKHPTSAGAQEPSTITHKMEGIDGFAEPVVFFEINENPENPEAGAGAKIEWHFNSAGLGTGGVYELDYTIIPVTLPIVGARMKFGLVDASGVEVGTTLHVVNIPGLAFREEGLGIAGEVSPAMENTPMEVKITLDLNNLTWSAVVDGNQLIDQSPLSEDLTLANPDLGVSSIDFGSDSGWRDTPNAAYALAKVKLVRLPEEKSE